MELDNDFTSGAINSDIMSQGIAPNPRENAKTQIQRLGRGRNETCEAASSPCSSRIQKYAPKELIDRAMMTPEEIKRQRRPYRSTTNIPVTVATTCNEMSKSMHINFSFNQ